MPDFCGFQNNTDDPGKSTKENMSSYPDPNTLFRGLSLAVAAFVSVALIFCPTAIAQTEPTGDSPGSPETEPKEEWIGVSSLEQRLLQQGLIDVRMLDPSIRVDLKYAKAENFMGSDIDRKSTRLNSSHYS